MQQTDKYKLNKPGVDDPIAIAPLNENADKIEAALSAKADAADVTDLNQRLQVFEAKKFAVGTYKAISGSDNGNLVTLEFTPYAVLIHYCGGGNGFMALALAGQNGDSLEIVENGFKTGVGGGYNIRAGNYTYIALG